METMPRPQAAELLDALRATPGDDELRLVYADTLEAAGDLARAELVRTQTAVARGGADAATRARAVTLQADRDRALEACAQFSASRGGLVWHVAARLDEWLAHGAALFATEPITSIAIGDPLDALDDTLLARLATAPWLAHVRALAIAPYSDLADPDLIAPLVRSPLLQRVTRLQVPHPSTAVAASRDLLQLRELHVHCEGSDGGDEVVAAFAARPLTRLELIGCGMTAEAMQAIAASAWNLVRLVTSGTSYVEDDIGEAGMHAIAAAPTLASLHELELERGCLDDAALRALAASAHLRALHALSFEGNPAITDAGVAALAASPVFATVRRLNLASTAVTERGVAALPAHVRVTR